MYYNLQKNNGPNQIEPKWRGLLRKARGVPNVSTWFLSNQRASMLKHDVVLPCIFIYSLPTPSTSFNLGPYSCCLLPTSTFLKRNLWFKSSSYIKEVGNAIIGDFFSYFNLLRKQIKDTGNRYLMTTHNMYSFELSPTYLLQFKLILNSISQTFLCKRRVSVV